MKSILLATTLLYFTHSSSAFSQTCEKITTAFDIGSGATKMKVAMVNTCEQRILKTLFEDSRPVEYKQKLKESKDNKFSAEIMNEGKKVLQELKQKAMEFKPTNFLAVATSAFRTAENGKEFAANLSKELKIDIQVIDQDEEAKLGFYGGVAKAKTKASNVVVWDIGGGSMQITTLENKKLKIYGGQIASVTFKNKVIEEILKKDSQKISSPNPLKAQSAAATELASKLAFEDVPKDMKEKFSRGDIEVIGIGGVHYYSVSGQLGKPETFTSNDIKKIMVKRSMLTDEQLESKYAETEVTNLALVAGFMDALKIKQVMPAKVNLTDGLLLKN